jgi:hypothetical protein
MPTAQATPPAVQPQQDPYAEFGGSVSSPPASAAPAPSAPSAASTDPYAEFGGSIVQSQQPATAPQQRPASDNLVQKPGFLETLKDTPIPGVATGQTFGNAVDVAKGFVKGAGDTASTVGDLIRGGVSAASALSPSRAGAYLADKTGLRPGAYQQEEQQRQQATNAVKDTLVPEQGQSAFKDINQATNPYQTGGKVAENVAEFMLGDEALKGLTTAQKLKKVATVVDAVQENSKFARALEIGMDAINNAGKRTALEAGLQRTALSAGESALHAPEGDRAKQAAIGAAVGGLGELGGAVVGKATNFLQTKTAAALLAKAAGNGDAAKTALNDIELVTNSGSEQESVTTLVKWAF